MINQFLSVALIPLLFGAFETNSFQNTFCNIHVFGISEFLQCDELRDNLTFRGGTNISLSVDNSTDTILIEHPAVTTIEVQTDPWYSRNTNVTAPLIHYVSDGSIIFNVTTIAP